MQLSEHSMKHLTTLQYHAEVFLPCEGLQININVEHQMVQNRLSDHVSDWFIGNAASRMRLSPQYGIR